MTENNSSAQKKYHAPVLGRKSLSDDFSFYGELIKRNDIRFAIDGVGVVGGRLISKNSDLYDVVDNIDCLSIKGSISIYTETVENQRKYFKINPDPIGACLIYKYEKNGVVGLSSDLRHLVDWLNGIGITVKKSVFYQALLLSINDGAFGYSSWEDIFALNSGEYVVAYGNQYCISNYGVEDFFKSEGSYPELLDLAQQDIENTISAISSSGLEKIAHLTGGMDSRLVVSAISASQKLSDYKIFCSGQRGFPDFDTAYSLCSVLGAKMTNRPTLLQDKIPENFEEYYRWSSEDNQGILPNQPTNTGVVGDKDVIVLSGGYGECLRGYHQHVKGLSLNSTVDNLWPLHDNQGNIRALTTKHVVDEIKNKLGCFLISKVVKGWSLNDALQLLYLQEKNRYFVGNISLAFSRHTPRIDPIYSLYGFKAAYKMNYEDRANRFFMFDLMKRFSEDLTKLKFGTTSWPDILLKRNNVSVEQFPDCKKVEFDHHTVKNSIPLLSGYSKSSKEEAIRIGAPVWQVHNYRQIQQYAKEIILKNPEFYGYFDKVKVLRLLNNKLENRQNIRKVFQLYYSLVWLYK